MFLNFLPYTALLMYLTLTQRATFKQMKMIDNDLVLPKITDNDWQWLLKAENYRQWQAMTNNDQRCPKLPTMTDNDKNGKTTRTTNMTNWQRQRRQTIHWLRIEWTIFISVVLFTCDINFIWEQHWTTLAILTIVCLFSQTLSSKCSLFTGCESHH